MRPSPSLLNAASHRVHTPLIRFVGKRNWPSTPEPQHPHPFAPADLQKSFQDFLNKFNSSKSASSSSLQTQSSTSSSKHSENVQVFNDFWQAPERLWKRQLTDAEIEAITSGGAL